MREYLERTTWPTLNNLHEPRFYSWTMFHETASKLFSHNVTTVRTFFSDRVLRSCSGWFRKTNGSSKTITFDRIKTRFFLSKYPVERTRVSGSCSIVRTLQFEIIRLLLQGRFLIICSWKDKCLESGLRLTITVDLTVLQIANVTRFRFLLFSDYFYPYLGLND